jgi:hypothetical protein
MRAAILISLLTLSSQLSAQTHHGEQPSVSRFRACVRSHAPDAQAAGVRTAEDAARYAMKACMPLVGLFLDPNASRNAEVEVLPPGIYRAVLREEWGDFVEQGNRQ